MLEKWRRGFPSLNPWMQKVYLLWISRACVLFFFSFFDLQNPSVPLVELRHWDRPNNPRRHGPSSCNVCKPVGHRLDHCLTRVVF